MSFSQEMQIDGGLEIFAETPLSENVSLSSDPMPGRQRKSLPSDFLQADVAGLRVGGLGATGLISDALGVAISAKQELPDIDALSILRTLVSRQFMEAAQEAASALAQKSSRRQRADRFANFSGLVEERLGADEFAEGFVARLQVLPLARPVVDQRASNVVFDRGDGYVLAVFDGKPLWCSVPDRAALNTRLSAIIDKPLISRLTDAYLQDNLTRPCYAEYRQYLYEYRTYGDLIGSIGERMALAGAVL